MGGKGVVLAGMLVLATAGGASGSVAVLGGPGQVNNDVAASIDPTKDAGAADVAGGSVTAGALQAPWAAFEQATTGAINVFVRAFVNGAWTTEGFPASLNFSTTQDAEAPSIDFAGTGRTVPWVSWYENVTAGGFGTTNILASRFAAQSGQWLREGQDRGSSVPSLNIHTNRTAENPSVAGGATTAGNDPTPWIGWEENDGLTTDLDSSRQIFVEKGVKQATSGATCTGFKPSAAATVGTFCWQQVGLDRLAPTQASITSSSTGDPTLNVDPTRAAVDPDIAFTGVNDTTPWVVWYEQGDSALTHGSFRSPERDQVFAAKAVADSSAGVDGGFHWQAIGSAATGTLDTTGTDNHFGPCAETQTEDDACSLNADATHDAEDPRVAAGTLTAGTATVPWVVWDEDPGNGVRQIFISHLVGGSHFVLFNNGVPLSNTINDAFLPDITFVGNEPYVSWHESVGGADKLFLGHFEGGASAPVFRLDTPTGIDAGSPFLSPISSTCTATPLSTDGASCPGGALGTPFALLITAASSPHRLFAETYAPDVTTGAASGVTASSATLAGTVTTAAPAASGFDLGTDTSYGAQLGLGTLGAAPAAQATTAAPTGLAASTTYHYRAFARNDFMTITGADATFTTGAAPPAPTGGGTGGTTPTTNARPSSKIVGLKKTVRAKALKSFHGTASDPDDGVARVDIALTRLVGHAHAAAVKSQCFVLTARGRLVRRALRKGRCAPAFVKAAGTTRWHLALKHRLPGGSYVLYSRATDRAGQRQLGFPAASRKAFRVR